jgi:hypothetical protein
VQSLAPAARQMASASAKVLSRAHGQPAFDAPHAEQPLGGGRQAGETWPSEQQRTSTQKWGRGVSMHRPCICM